MLIFILFLLCASDLSVEELFADGYAKSMRARTTEEKMEAGDVFLKVIRLAPTHKGAYFYLSLILCEIGASSRQMMELTIQIVSVTVQFDDFTKITDFYSCVANLMVSLDRGEAAFEFAKKGTYADPTQTSGWLSLARIKVALGENEEALKYVNKCLELEPANQIAWNMKSSLTKFDGTEPELQLLFDTAENEELDAENRAQLYFVLGKAYRDAKNYDKSMSMYLKGNEQRRIQFDWNIQIFKDELNAHKNAFTKDFLRLMLEQTERENAIEDAPIFIVGLPRSGSTLIETILSTQSHIIPAGENTAWAPLVNLFDRTYQDQLNGLTYPASVQRLGAGALHDFGQFYIREMRDQLNTTKANDRWTDKMLRNFVHIGMIALALPNARIICTSRHPLDNSFSIFKTVFQNVGSIPYAYNLKEIGEYYTVYRQFIEYWQSVIPGDRLLVMHYEDMIDNFETSTKRIFNFLDLEWDPAVLEFHKSKRHVHTASAQQVRKPIYKSAVGSWKPYAKRLGPLAEVLGKYLTTEERNAIFSKDEL